MCCGSVMVTKSTFQSSHSGSSPSLETPDHYSIRLDSGTRLIGAFIISGWYIGTSLADPESYNWL